MSERFTGRPTIALDIASARRWLNRILKKMDMEEDDEAGLRAAINILRALEESEKAMVRVA